MGSDEEGFGSFAGSLFILYIFSYIVDTCVLEMPKGIPCRLDHFVQSYYWLGEIKIQPVRSQAHVLSPPVSFSIKADSL